MVPLCRKAPAGMRRCAPGRDAAGRLGPAGPWPPSSASSSAAAVALLSRRNCSQRSASSSSPIAAAETPSMCSAAQEAAVRLVLPRDRAVSVPARAAQLIQAAMVTRPRVRVGGDRVALAERAGRQRRPGRRVRREPRRDLLGRLARPQRGVGLLVGGQVGGRRPAQQVLTFHPCPLAQSRSSVSWLSLVAQLSWWPADSRSSQAWVTRAAMPASPALPQLRGSYTFLLPTSPSIFSTPS